ncbi:MAG: hypothetical protein ACRDPK_21030 [Carbonactinosporaceae bacterium]
MAASIAGLTAAAAMLVSACGKEPQAMSDRAARTLGDRVSAVHSTLTQREWSRARDQLAELRQLVQRERDRGHISSRRADRILEAASRLGNGLPRPEPRKPARVRHQPAPDGKGKAPGRGHGHGGDHGNEGGHGSDEQGDEDDD